MIETKKQKIWEERYAFGDASRDAAVEEISRELGVSLLFAVLLYNRGYTSASAAKRFLRFDKEDFHDPFLMADMDKATDRILAAVDNGEKIYVYGDYDVDGVTSVSTLYLYLTSLGADVGIKIPKRDGEGYGVSNAAVEVIAGEGATLIITVDTGITAHGEVELGRSLGVDFVITDHHECHGEIPKACAVVNPHRQDCEYPFAELAGVGVIFKTVCACEMKRQRRMGGSVVEAIKRICEEYCDLVAVGTIADVMPLTDENRLIVSLGLQRLSRGEGRPGLLALLDASGKKAADCADKKVTSGMIGFGIAPRINAAGRISDATIAVKLLLAEDPVEVKKYAEELCEINKQRQHEENRIATEAYEMLERDGRAEDKVIILDSDTWQQGIIGIVSSRITERYGVPSILVSFRGSFDGESSEEDDGKGSGRSVKGMNLVEALTYCDDLLVKYGGHELAAGLTVKRGKIDEFRKRINEYAAERITDDMLCVNAYADCEMPTEWISMEHAEEIQRLEPFGISNSTPQFILKGANVVRISFIGGGKHTKLLVEKDGVLMTAMCFGMTEEDAFFRTGDCIDLLFNLDINDFKGVRSVQLLVQDVRFSKEKEDRLNAEKEQYARIRAGGGFSAEDGIVPTRDDFARVYTVLRKEYRAENDTMDVLDIQKAVNAQSEEPIGYTKLKFILVILNELNICEIDEISADVYRYSIYFNANKTCIDKSSILKRLRAQCHRQ